MNPAQAKHNVRPHRTSHLTRDTRGLTPLVDLVINFARPDRVEPRVIKRRGKQYDLMNRPRQELKQRLERQRLAA